MTPDDMTPDDMTTDDMAPEVILVHVPAHCDLGWVGEAGIDPVRRGLAARGWTPTLWTVPDAEALRRRLAGAPRALFWPNAYHIDDGPRTVSLPALLADAGHPCVGSPAAALDLMLDKPRCQRALAAAGIPTPCHVTVEGSVDAERLRAAGLRLPVIVKPADRCGSEGIDLDAVCATFAEAAARASAASARFGRVMVEDFLPGGDLTVAAIERPDGWQTLATWYRVDDRPPDRCPLDRRSRMMPWGGPKHMDPVTDAGLLRQVESLAPAICAAVGVRDVTRFDGRTDADGRLRIFDVNGMPALAWPDGVMVSQVFAIRTGGRHDFDAFADLVDAIVRSAARRAGAPAPSSGSTSAL